MTIKLLIEHHLEFISLKRGWTGSSESTLVKMPHFWKSHVAAHIVSTNFYILFCKQCRRRLDKSNLGEERRRMNNTNSPLTCKWPLKNNPYPHCFFIHATNPYLRVWIEYNA